MDRLLKTAAVSLAKKQEKPCSQWMCCVWTVLFSFAISWHFVWTSPKESQSMNNVGSTCLCYFSIINDLLFVKHYCVRSLFQNEISHFYKKQPVMRNLVYSHHVCFFVMVYLQAVPSCMMIPTSVFDQKGGEKKTVVVFWNIIPYLPLSLVFCHYRWTSSNCWDHDSEK